MKKLEKNNKEAIKKALQELCESVKNVPIPKNDEERKALDNIWNEVDELTSFMRNIIKENTKK